MKPYAYLLFLLLLSVTGTSQNISNIEYFIDSDPGFGLATQGAVTPGSNILSTINVSLSGVSKGFHTIFVRVRDSNRKWSMSQEVPFYCTTISSQNNISQIEYFIDNDPGFGSANQVFYTPANNISSNVNIPLISASTGFHTLYIRAKDTNGRWSFCQISPFYCISFSGQKNIIQMEYFLDNDPGFGDAIQVSNSVVPNITSNLNIPLNSVSVGFHTLFFRVKDSNGKWSLSQVVSFYCGSLSGQKNINGIEYFIDNDPGFGQANQLSISASNDISSNITVPLNSVNPGFHSIYFRVQDSNGKWSLSQVAPFYCISVNSQNTLTKMEYFFDTDPGFGNANQLTVTNGSSFTSNISIPLSSINTGFHTLYVRIKDSNGRWSLTQMSPFYCLVLNSQKNITKIEYYLDSDPGFGNGMNITINPSSNIIQTIVANLTGASAGMHIIYFRVEDNQGQWSLTNYDTITIVSLPHFIAQPLNISICSGSNAIFSIISSAASYFQWQVNSGGGYTDISNNGLFAGANSDTLFVNGASSVMNGYLFRCLAIDFIQDTSVSSYAVLNMINFPVINLGNDTDLCPGSNLTLDAGNPGSSYIWSLASQNLQTLVIDTSMIHLPTNYIYVTVTNSTGCSTEDSIKITLDTNSVAPVGINASSTTICDGYAISLTVSGGGAGTGAIWYWYSGICGGLFENNNDSLVVSPSITTEYFLRAEGKCNTTNCVSITITVEDSSSLSNSIILSKDTVCAGTFDTLNISGGNPGTFSNWYWYLNSCGSNLAGIGDSLIVSPMLTTTYYVRLEGICNTTLCVNKTVYVNVSSIQADSITGSSNVICLGSSATLGISGGSLGTGANWYWYELSCGGTLIASGQSLVSMPVITTVYYLRAEGLCNSTSCDSTTVTVNLLSDSASSVSGNFPICAGGSTTLGIVGGSLGTGATWFWYSGLCGGIYVTSGLAPILSPSVATIYYVRAESGCNTTGCESILISVNTNSFPADSISATQTTICSGNPVTMTVSGGIMGTNAEWFWYYGSCGGTLAGSGASIIINPLNTISYFVRAEGICNSTICVSKNVLVNPLPMPAVSSNGPVCYGDTLRLFCNGGTNYQWTGSGNFSSILQNPFADNFTSNGTYYVTVTAAFACTAIDSITVFLQPLSTLQGFLIYHGASMNSVNANIELFKEQNSFYYYYDSINYSGGYLVNNLVPGNYIIKATIHGNQYPHVLPTYFDSAYTWQSADTITIHCNSTVTKNIRMFEMNVQPGGVGTISGNIWYSGTGTKSIGEPVPGAEVFLSQEPGDDPISDSQTDTSGYYGFGSIPTEVTYKLFVDIPGFPLISTYSIHLTQFDFAFQHINFIVDTSDTGRGIYRMGGTGINDINIPGFTISIYPNPYKDILFLNYKLDKTSQVLIELSDIFDRKLSIIVDARQIEGTYNYVVDNNFIHLKQGVYLLKLHINEKILIEKVVKTD